MFVNGVQQLEIDDLNASQKEEIFAAETVESAVVYGEEGLHAIFDANNTIKARGATHAIVRWCQAIVFSNAFELVVTLFILLNAITLGMWRYDLDEDVAHRLDIVNDVCNGVFFAELFVKVW